MSPPGIAGQELQNRMRVFLIREQTEQDQCVVEAAVGDKQAVLVEGVRFAGVAHAAELQDASEFLFGLNSQREDGHDLKTIVADRRGDEHRRHASADTAILIL